MLVLWGSVLSPFALKTRAMLQHARVPFRFLPDEGTRLENLRIDAQIELAKRLHRVERHGGSSPLDELPLVPFLVEGARVTYDSTAIGRWLTEQHGARLVPDTALERAVALLIDEAFDELGLYCLHHNRWVVSAREVDAHLRLAHEFRTLVPTQGLFARWFRRRQTRRLRYLFSIGPGDAFPETHGLLEEIWGAWVDAVDALVQQRPFLLGERFTIADASVFGQLGGNFIDQTARARLRMRGPHAYAWLERIWRGEHVGSDGELSVDDALTPLLRSIDRTFVPLVLQNEAAHRRHLAAGETLFNEPAFDRGRALYDGELLGRPFRSVVKTFQVRALHDLRAAFASVDRARLPALPDL